MFNPKRLPHRTYNDLANLFIDGVPHQDAALRAQVEIGMARDFYAWMNCQSTTVPDAQFQVYPEGVY